MSNQDSSLPESAAGGRPRIGITMDVGTPDEGRQVLELPADYAARIFEAGGMAVLLAYTHEAGIRQEMIGALDGLLVPGGRDLDPRLYGQERHAATRLTDKDRQDFDLALLALAEARGMPTLGICLGCQAMNVQRRGTLHQHLPEREGAGGAVVAHRKAGDRSNLHEVEIGAETRLAAALGSGGGTSGGGRVTVNSRHHQGIDRMGQGLVACAVAADGLVEAVEDPSLAFWVGVQWHPENMGGGVQDGLFAALVKAAREYRGRREVGRG